MTEQPDPNEMLLSAQRNLDFFLKTFYLHFLPDWEQLKTPPTGENEDQRKKRLIAEKESFLQSGLVILFNSAEIYLKSIIAKKSVFLLLKDLNDSHKSKSFFECSTLDAANLHKIAASISGNSLPPRFDEIYESLRKERNKVIHLGKSNSNAVRKNLIESFLVLYDQVSEKSLLEMSEALFDKTQLSSEEIENYKKEHTSIIIAIMKAFFPLDEIIKDSFSLDNTPKQWTKCTHCNTPNNTLATISTRKSLCLACSFRNGV
ncbi:hypothetical protein PEC311524_10570 [Pectobacterium carotovorum subsp. carotovorum]|nr:hypothetical protein PEC311524_10570 [Pectobacterium carotovorum subsp. carotovorum]